MCIVVDANTWGYVFQENNKKHSDYLPVFRWITKGPGFVVYGGSKYREELKNASKYYGIFLELKKKGRAKEVNPNLVDKHEADVRRAAGTPKCHDAHLIAIFRVSGCRLLCSDDRRSDTYIKNRKYYLAGQRPPSIYRSNVHQHLLNDRNIVQISHEI